GQKQFAHVWKFLAHRYRSNPTVAGVDILNEPYNLLSDTWAHTSTVSAKKLKLAAFYTRMGKAIHHVNKKVLLFFEDHYIRQKHKWSVLSKPHGKKLV